jgi:CRP-like cAMP-binding protein
VADAISEEHLNTLRTSVPFRGLDPEDLEVVRGRCRVHEFGAGEVVLSEGEYGPGLFIILAGEVEFFLPAVAPDGARRTSEVSFRIQGPGTAFGEYSLVDRWPVSASARAVQPIVLGLVTNRALEEIVSRNDRAGKLIFRNLLRSLVARLREKDASLDDVLLAY